MRQPYQRWAPTVEDSAVRLFLRNSNKKTFSAVKFL